jgi:metallophosphoesterase (TIGR00282 family)
LEKNLFDNINVLFIGDIVGEPGLKFLEENYNYLFETYNVNFCIANGENVAGGKGITKSEAKRIFDLGVGVITTGNHVWDNWQAKPLLSSTSMVLRPLNYPQGNAGFGYTVYKFNDKLNIGVINLQGRTFMQTIDCPFKAIDHALKMLSEKTNIVFVDFHAETTAEKIAMSHYLDGRVSALVGTHTHIQTADARIMPEGTAYITDVGMTGPYDSVVGLKKDIAIKRFTLQTPHKFELATDDVRICGVVINISLETGKANSIKSFTYPEFNKNI